MASLGEEIGEEEADELIAQADKGAKDYCDFEEFIQLLNVPAGGEQKSARHTLLQTCQPPSYDNI